MSSTLKGSREICGYLGVGRNLMPALIDAGMPVQMVGNVVLADRLALRQWLGVKLPETKAHTLTKAEIVRILAE